VNGAAATSRRRNADLRPHRFRSRIRFAYYEWSHCRPENVMAHADAQPTPTFLDRRRVVLATWGLAVVAALAPLVVTVALLDVAGALFLLAGGLRLAFALRQERGPSRLAGLTAVVLGLSLIAVSGVGIWSLPVLFAVYLAVEAVLRLVQAVRRDNVRLYSSGVLAGLIALGIWQDVFCGGFGLFGPLVGLELAAVGWAFDEPPKAG
jgi:uncharacterized membrane protein HdeD (DUF308 family)